MRFLYLIIFIASVVSCTPQNEVFETSFTNNPLVFSTDTILFDTLISTGKVSVSKRLLVYNKSSKAININKITIGNKSLSPFSVYVNGRKGVEFSDVELLGNDSLLVLVNVTLNPVNSDNIFIVTDSINFMVSNFRSRVILNTWGEDAYYHVNDTISTNVLFQNNKPHVFYGNNFVDSNATLTIEKGSELLFYNNSSLSIKGILNAAGEKFNRIKMSALRQDGDYKYLPGQWSGLTFMSKNKKHIFSWVSISNMVNGLFFNKNLNNTCEINNCSISYASNSCIVNYDSKILLTNSLIFKSKSNLVKVYGGEFYAYSNTFSNASGFNTDAPSILITDDFESCKLSLINNIIWGTNKDELIIQLKNSSLTNIIRNNIIKKDTLIGYEANIFIKDNSGFKFENINENNFKTDTLSESPLVLSPALNVGEIIIGTTDVEDFNANFRDSKPDIGAIEFIE